MTKIEKNRLRGRAKRKLPSLMREFGDKCVWCDQRIVLTRHFKKRLASITAKVVTYIGPFGKVVTSLRATVDHLTPISKGGLSNRENLVPACSNCNGKRAQTKHAHKFVERERIIREQRAKSGVCSLTIIAGSRAGGNVNTSNFMVWISDPRPAPRLADFLNLLRQDNNLVFGKDD